MKKSLILLIVPLIFFPHALLASTEAEKAELRRIIKELQYLETDISKISQLRRVDDLEAFNYEALANDLSAVREAVKRHISAPSRQPRKLQPLTLEYGNIH